MKTETNDIKQEIKSEMKDIKENLKFFKTLIMDQSNIHKSSPTQKDELTPTDPTTVGPTNRRSPPLEGGNPTKIGGMLTLKNDIISPTCYELLIKIELKVDTALDIKDLFNHIKMCLNAVTRLREDLLPDYHSINRYSQFE